MQIISTFWELLLSASWLLSFLTLAKGQSDSTTETQAFAAALPPPPLRAALFTTDNDTSVRCNSMRDALNFYGIENVEISVHKSGLNGDVPLRGSSGEPLYRLLVFCVDRVSYFYSKSGWASAFSDDQWRQIEDYQRMYQVRKVSFDVYPLGVPGVDFASTNNATGCCNPDVEQTLRWYPDTVLSSLSISTKIANPSELTTVGLYHYPAVVTNTTFNTPFMKFAALPPDFPTESVAAIVVRQDQREEMLFFLTFATWSPTSAYLCDAWIQWGMRDEAYTGYGRKMESEIAKTRQSMTLPPGSRASPLTSPGWTALSLGTMALVVSLYRL